MDRNELLEWLAEEDLLEVVGAKIENVTQIPLLLADIGYLEDEEDVIFQINKCEIHPEQLEIIDFAVKDKKILIRFEMPFILFAFCDEEAFLRITATAVGQCLVPDVDVFDWESAFEEAFVDEGIIEITEFSYTDEECDDLRAVFGNKQ